MPHQPLHVGPRSPGGGKSRSGIGPPRRASQSLSRIGRRGLLLVLCMAACVALVFAAISLLPTHYVAECRLLMSATAPFSEQRAAFMTPEIARQVINEVHLGGQPGFVLPPQLPWWRTPQLDAADVWIFEQTGLSPLSWVPEPESSVEARFWSHVSIEQLGQSTRVMVIKVVADDPVQAADIANALARAQPIGASLLSGASLPATPYFPPADDVLLWGVAIGLFVGVIVLWSLGGSSRNFQRPEEIETAAGLPVLAQVPRLSDGNIAIIHVLRDPASDYSEALRRLHIALQSPSNAAAPRTVGIASALPGEGRSTLAASLGRLLAGEGKRVLLIDCDWRHPDLHHLFRLTNDSGLSALLADDRIALDDVIQTDALSGLDIITSGRRSKKAHRLLLSERMRSLLVGLQSSYDLVLLDLPPVLAAGEVLLLARLVDQVMFLVRWRHTRRRQALSAIEQILGTEGEISGVVLVRVDPVKP